MCVPLKNHLKRGKTTKIKQIQIKTKKKMGTRKRKRDSDSTSNSEGVVPEDFMIFNPSKFLNLIIEDIDSEIGRRRSEGSPEAADPFFDDTLPPFVPSTIKKVNSLDDLITLAGEYGDFVSDKAPASSAIRRSPRLAEGTARRPLGRSPPRKRRKTTEITKHPNYIFHKLFQIKDDLQALNDLLGMKELKHSIVNQVLYFLQGLHEQDMMHSILCGAPGTGKTTVARILGEIYRKIGMVRTGEFKIANRSDFVGKYLGHTAEKTTKFLNGCVGNILFIDEAYSLGPHRDDHDAFSKEAIDTLNQFLSEHSHEFICIIAGYEDSLKYSFFHQNPGLERRFTWKFRMDPYTIQDLEQIFRSCIKRSQWSLSPTCELVFIFCPQYKHLFANSGGDCEILFNKCKIEHSNRIFLVVPSSKDLERESKVLNQEDLSNGFDQFKIYKKSLDAHAQQGFNSMFS